MVGFFKNSAEVGRLDLSVEALVLENKYNNLFTSFEKKKCKDRLEKYEYFK
jgi:hypothetical protein